ncbi:DUF6302 family protein [Streptomyces sp. NPDC001889]
MVSFGAAQAAPGYRAAVWSLDDPALLAAAVTVYFAGAGEEGVLAVPAGETRLGGALAAGPREVGEAVAAALEMLSRFGGVRLLSDGRGETVVVWGARCPSRISAVGRIRFFGSGDLDGSTARGRRRSGGRVRLVDAVVLDALAHGTDAGTLVGCQLAASEGEVHERMASLGRALTGWPGLTWTGLVHEAVCRGLIPVRPSRPVWLGPAALRLLEAWASGMPADRYTELNGPVPAVAGDTERAVLAGLGALSAPHAVLRAHESGLLHRPAGGGRGP